MTAILQHTDWSRVQALCAQVALARQDGFAGSLRKRIASGLTDAGFLVRENARLPAYYQGREVSSCDVPLLVDETGGVFFDDAPLEKPLAEKRLANLCETLGLQAAVLVASNGAVLACRASL